MKKTSAVRPDVANVDPSYWEKILEQLGLSMDRGAPSRSGFGNDPDVILFSDLKGQEKNEIGV